MSSNGQCAIAQRSEDPTWECTAEHARDLHETFFEEEMLRGLRLEIVLGDFPSHSMHEKGEQGSQTTSLPVSMYREIVWDEREKERV